MAETLLKIASSDGTDGDAAMDMQAYVEFQQTLGDVLKTHRSALAANRKFWRLLMKEVLTFRALSASLAEIEFFEAKAEKAYALVLEKHPKNVILLRAYASFCEDVKNDPWRAQKVLLEAEKIDATRTMGRGDGEDDQGGGGVDDKLDCVVVISGTGTIKIANKNMHKLLGYKKKDELVGKNVSVIMPKPYNQQHNGYLKRFAKTQKSTILDSKQRLEARPCQPPPGWVAMPQACRRLPRRGRKVLGASTLNPPAAVNSPANPQALHKNGQLINISLVVSRIESGGEVCFMGVIKELVDDTAVLSLDPDGVIRTMNSPAADMFGYTAMEVGPPSLRSLLP